MRYVAARHDRDVLRRVDEMAARHGTAAAVHSMRGAGGRSNGSPLLRRRLDGACYPALHEAFVCAERGVVRDLRVQEDMSGVDGMSAGWVSPWRPVPRLPGRQCRPASRRRTRRGAHRYLRVTNHERVTDGLERERRTVLRDRVDAGVFVV